MGKSKFRRQERKIRRLKIELRYLQDYLDEVEETLLDYEADWESDYVAIIRALEGRENDRGVDDNNDPGSGLVTQSNTDESPLDDQQCDESGASNLDPACSPPDRNPPPEWIKRLYRLVALETHPDRQRDPAKVKEMLKLFQRAQVAMDEKDWDGLVAVALGLGIETHPDPEEFLEWLDRRIKQINKTLKTKQDCIAWVWGEIQDDDIEMKVNVFEKVLCWGKYPNPDVNKIREVLQKK